MTKAPETPAAQALAVYSARFEEQQAAERNQSAVANENTQLQAAVRDAKTRLAELRSESIASVLSDVRLAESKGSEIAAGFATAELLNATLEHHSAYTLADGRRALLVAQIASTESQIRAEQLRATEHDERLTAALAVASELEQGLEVTITGGYSDKVREIIARLSRQLTAARRALVEHDEATAAARRAMEKESV